MSSTNHMPRHRTIIAGDKQPDMDGFADELTRNKNLETLTLGNLRLDAVKAGTLADALKHHIRLRQLAFISMDCFPHGAAEELFSIPTTNCKITDFKISRTPAIRHAMQAGADLLAGNTAIHRFELYHDNLRDADIETLAGGLGQNKSLTHLLLGHNQFGDDGAVALAGALQAHPCIRTLDFSHNKIGAAGGKAIAALIGASQQLYHINLNGNAMGDGCAAALVDALKDNQHLAHISMAHTQLSDKAIGTISEAMVESGNRNLIDAGTGVPHTELRAMCHRNLKAAREFLRHCRSPGALSARQIQNGEGRENAILHEFERGMGILRERDVKQELARLDETIRQLPRLEDLPSLSPETLTRPMVERDGLAPLDNPHIWEEIGAVSAKLAANGTPLTRRDLLKTNRLGQSFLKTGIECGQLTGIIHLLAHNGEAITPDDLLDAQGKPNRLLETIMEDGMLPRLFSAKNWQQQPHRAYRQIYDALPDEAQAQITNLHALSAATRPQGSRHR